MPAASGSIAFLGAARFQGFWNAETNAATGSGLASSVATPYAHPTRIAGLFATASSTTHATTGDTLGGYAKEVQINSSYVAISASIGDYWQVTGSGTHNVDGLTTWNLNDWCIYSGSAGDTAWHRLAFEDTIGSIILGDLSSSSFHMGVEFDKQVLFNKTVGTTAVHSGSDDFAYDYTNSRVGIGTNTPSTKLHLNGASGEVELRLQSSNKYSSIIQKDNAELIIQNASNGPIILYDDTAERMRITNDGKVGIGSATPAYKLDVVGNIVGGTSANSHGHVSVRRDGYIVGGMNTQGGVFNLYGSTTVTDTHLTVRSTGKIGIGTVDPAYTLDVIGNVVGGTSANSHGHVSVRRDGSVVGGMNTQGGVFNLHGSSTATDQHLTIRSDGKIGIGTSSPSNKLQIDHTGADGDDGLMIVRADSSTADTNLLGGIGFDSTDGNVPSTITEASVFIAAYAAEDHGTDDKGGDLVFGTSVIDDNDDTTSTEHMRILDSGNVGIGVADPDSKLEVFGTSTQLKLSYNADDYATLTVADTGDLTIATVGDGSTDSDLILDVDGDIEINADGGDITFKDGTTTALILDMDTTSGACFFQNGAGNMVFGIDDGDRKLYLFDKGGEYLESDGTDLTIAAGTAINIAAGTLDLSAQTVDVTLNAAVDALNFDSNTLSIDASNNRVGIGNAAPGSSLEVTATAASSEATRPTIEISSFSDANDASTSAGVLKFHKSANDTINTYGANSHTVLGEVLGRIEAWGVTNADDNSSDAPKLSSYIEFSGDAAADNDSVPGKIVFATSDADDAGTPTERMRITDGGDVGIGTSSPDGNLEILNEDGDADLYLSGIGDSNIRGGSIFMQAARNTAASPNTSSADDRLGQILFRAHDGAGYHVAASIKGYADAAVGDDTTDTPGRLEFATTPDGEITPTERMTIKNDGKIGIGNADPGSLLEVTATAANSEATRPTIEISSFSDADDASTSAGVLKFHKSANDTINTYGGGSHTVSGEVLGRIEAWGVTNDDDGSSDAPKLSSYIEFAGDAVADETDVPGKIVFATADADDNGTPTVRLTIDDDGLANFVGAVTVGGTLTVDSVGVTAIQTSGESFADNNTSLMTSAAIDDRINAAVASEDTLAEMNDTNITGLAAGHIIVYDDTASVWDNVAMAGTSNEVDVTLGDGTLQVGLPNDVTLTGDLTVSGGDVTYGNGQNATLGVTATAAGTAGKSLTITSGGVTAGSGTANRTGGDLVLSSGAATGTGTSSIQFKTAVAGSSGTAAAAPAERMRIHTDGNVGIGDSAPGTLLQLKGADAYLTLQNSTSENSAGGCETKIIFEDHGNNALGQIEVSHVGSSDDEKGQLILKTNNDSGLQTALTISEAQLVTFAGGFAVGSDAEGDMLYHNGTKYVRLAKGSDDDVLTMNGNVPNWEAASGGGSARSVAGDTDNGIITWVTSDNTFAAEANFTYDGTDLAVTCDTATLTSANASDPIVIVKNTTNDASGARLRFVKDKGAAGAANDVAGLIEFYADDANQDNICFASVTGSVATHTNGQEGGKFAVGVASHNGAMVTALELTDGNAAGEVDVTIAAGASSVTTVSGLLTTTGETKVGASAGSGADAFLYTAGDAAHVGLQWDADGNTEGTLIGGADGHGVDFIFYGETAGKHVQWDMSSDELVLASSTRLSFHDAAGGEYIHASGDNVLEFYAGTNMKFNTDTVEFLSANADDPVVIIKNTTNDATGARLQLVKDRGSNNGAANDVNGLIQFWGTDGGSDQVLFSEIKSQVKVHTDGQEGGKFTVSVAEHDGTLTQGLLVEDGDNDGELDVTIGAGAASIVTVPGTMDIAGAVDIAGDLTLSAGGDGALTFSNAGENSIKIPDNQASALIIEEANNAYMTFVSTDSSEKITVAKTLDVDAAITVDPGSGAAASAVKVTNTDADQIAIEIVASNTTADVLSITADDVLTTGNAIFIDHNDAITTNSHNAVGMHYDFDKDGVTANSATQTFIGFDLDMNDGADNHNGSTVTMTGMDIDVVAADADNTSKNIGLDVTVSGAATNYAATFMGGNVGVGSNAPTMPLVVYGNSAGAPIAAFINDGNVANRYGISIDAGLDASDGTAPTSNLWAVLNDGDGDNKAYIAWVNGSSNAGFVAASDERIKTDIAPTKINALEVLENIPLSEFRMARKNKPIGELVKIGFIAQDCEQAWPDMVSEHDDKNYDHKLKAVAPSTLIPLLVKAVQELSAEIKELKGE